VPDADPDTGPFAADPSADDHATTFKLQHSFGQTTPLPLDTLSPEALERLRNGGQLTELELAILRREAARSGSLGARLFDTLISSGMFDVRTIDGPAPAGPADDNAGVVVSGPTQVFEWRLGADAESTDQPLRTPATYYEALSGQPDPARDFFITTRRILRLIVVGLALAIPVGVVALTILLGESLETILFFGIGASIVGLMLLRTFPRTPFD
jgi:hypothetical protein